tara:strand:+ start:309 stop:455 length:147 start_codon:yes stop_codon:yes gene_type:complete
MHASSIPRRKRRRSEGEGEGEGDGGGGGGGERRKEGADNSPHSKRRTV